MPADMLKRRLTLITVISIPALLLLILLLDPWNLRDRNSRSIALKNMEEVDRIVLIDSYNTSELSKENDSWYLFGREELNPVTVENLLYASTRLEVASIVDLTVFEEAHGTQEGSVELAFFRQDRVLLEFKMKKVSGKFLIHPSDSDEAFYVSLPGYPGLDLDRVFSANPDHYRDHLLIDLRPSDIRSVEIKLSSGEAFRFTRDQDGLISCEPANAETILPDAAPNELAIKLLFSYFTSIRYEEGAGILADSLLMDKARDHKTGSIEVVSASGEHHSLQVFSYHESPDSEAHLFRALVLYNEQQDALFVNYIYLDVLMRGLSHYFGEK